MVWDTKTSQFVMGQPRWETYSPTSRPTFLDAVLQVVDDGRQDSGQTHDLGTLGQTEGEELIPAGPYQAGIAVLPGDTEVRVGAGVSWHFSKPQHAPNKWIQQVCIEGLWYIQDHFLRTPLYKNL